VAHSAKAASKSSTPAARTSGSTEIVNAGGTDFFGGGQIVAEGGTTGSTTVSGGIEIVNAGGTALGALTSAGDQDVFGLTSGGTVS